MPLSNCKRSLRKSHTTSPKELREINWREPETFTFDEYLADFRTDFHDIHGDAVFAKCLNPTRYRIFKHWLGGCWRPVQAAPIIRAGGTKAGPVSLVSGQHSR